MRRSCPARRALKEFEPPTTTGARQVRPIGEGPSAAPSPSRRAGRRPMTPRLRRFPRRTGGDQCHARPERAVATRSSPGQPSLARSWRSDGRRPAGVLGGYPRPADRQRADPIQEACSRRHPRALLPPLTAHHPLLTCRDRSTCSTTRSLLPGALLAPVTLAAGPSPASTWQWCSPSPPRRRRRRWSQALVSWLPPPMSEGCCSLLSVHGRPDQGHLNLAFVAVIPLPRSTRRMVVRQRWNPFGVGAVLGALGVAQFFTSVEIWSTQRGRRDRPAVPGGGRPHEVARRARHVASGLAIGFGVFAVVVAYPATIALTGGPHEGPIQAGLAGSRTTWSAPSPPRHCSSSTPAPSAPRSLAAISTRTVALSGSSS